MSSFARTTKEQQHHHPTTFLATSLLANPDETSSSKVNNNNNDDDDDKDQKVEEEGTTTTPTTTLTLFSPCKINLFLRIIRKRDDGYHELASLFQAIGFGDTLELTPLFHSDNDSNDDTTTTTTMNQKGEDIFTCNMPNIPIDSSNLVLRALELMRTKTNQHHCYFNANLIKQVPAQAGLGGGSANAATAMWGANVLMGYPASMEQMIEWSGELGSDITFFLSRGTAYCTGRGEILTPIEPPLPQGTTKLCIVKPKHIGLSTPTVFQAIHYDELSQLDPDQTLLPAFLNAHNNNMDGDGGGGVETVPAEYYVNDLEPPAFRCVPELGQLKQRLQSIDGFHHVMMSGSGTSIFCIGEPKDKNAFLQEFGESDDLQVFFSDFINREEGKWFQKPSSP